MLIMMMMILTMIMVLILARYFSSLLFTVFLNHFFFPFLHSHQWFRLYLFQSVFILYSLFFIFPMTYVPLPLFLNTSKISPLLWLYTSFNFFCFVLISFYFDFSVDGKFNSKSVSRKRKRFPATKHAFQSR